MDVVTSLHYIHTLPTVLTDLLTYLLTYFPHNTQSLAHNKITRDLAAKATVLLKNDGGILPLSLSTAKPLKIAIIGKQGSKDFPHWPVVHGGGSGQVIPYYVSAPIDAIRVKMGLPPIPPPPPPPPPGPNNCSSKHYDVGFDYRNTDSQSNAPAKSVDECCNLCANRRGGSCNYFTFATDTKTCWMKATNHNRVADPTAISGSCHSTGPAPAPGPGPSPLPSCVGNHCVFYADGTDIDAAAKLAATVDIAIVFAQTSSSEGGDRGSLSLDDNADALIAAVAFAAGKERTIVDMVQPGAVLTPWRNNVSAILAHFMPGQEFGNALVDVLFGDVSPSARLPLTFPARENQVNFTTAQWPGVNKESTVCIYWICSRTSPPLPLSPFPHTPHTHTSPPPPLSVSVVPCRCFLQYSEKLLVGYRYYDAKHEVPAFPFGHGLSYSSFSYADLKASKSTVSFTLKNTGAVHASEVPQLYLTFPASSGEPPQQLKGFQQVPLAPGASATVTFALDSRAISIWDIASRKWAEQSGSFGVMVGASSRDSKLTGSFTV